MRWLAGLVLAVAATALPRAIEACTCQGPNVGIQYPRDGESDVPVNAGVLTVLPVEDVPSIQLIGPRGDAIAVAVVEGGPLGADSGLSAWILRPANPLEANQGYRIIEQNQERRFLTGRSQDVAGPRLTNFSILARVEHVDQSIEGLDVCEPLLAAGDLNPRIDLRIADPTDDRASAEGILHEFVIEEGSAMTTYRSIGRWIPHGSGCGALSFCARELRPAAPLHGEELCVSARLVDVSGNVTRDRFCAPIESHAISIDWNSDIPGPVCTDLGEVSSDLDYLDPTCGCRSIAGHRSNSAASALLLMAVLIASRFACSRGWLRRAASKV